MACNGDGDGLRDGGYPETLLYIVPSFRLRDGREVGDGEGFVVKGEDIGRDSACVCGVFTVGDGRHGESVDLCEE